MIFYGWSFGGVGDELRAAHRSWRRYRLSRDRETTLLVPSPLVPRGSVPMQLAICRRASENGLAMQHDREEHQQSKTFLLAFGVMALMFVAACYGVVVALWAIGWLMGRD